MLGLVTLCCIALRKRSPSHHQSLMENQRKWFPAIAAENKFKYQQRAMVRRNKDPTNNAVRSARNAAKHGVVDSAFILARISVGDVARTGSSRSLDVLIVPSKAFSHQFPRKSRKTSSCRRCTADLESDSGTLIVTEHYLQANQSVICA